MKIVNKAILCLSMLLAFLSGCKKDDSNKSTPSVKKEKIFKTTDFRVHKTEIYSNNTTPNVKTITYDVANITDTDYVRNDENGYFVIHWAMKGSNDNWYEKDTRINNLEANTIKTSYLTIVAPVGVTLYTAPSFTYEIQEEK